jgi:hypothetical protein
VVLLVAVGAAGGHRSEAGGEEHRQHHVHRTRGGHHVHEVLEGARRVPRLLLQLPRRRLGEGLPVDVEQASRDLQQLTPDRRAELADEHHLGVRGLAQHRNDGHGALVADDLALELGPLGRAPRREGHVEDPAVVADLLADPMERHAHTGVGGRAELSRCRR